MSCDVLIGNFPHQIGEKTFFTLGLGPIFRPQKNTVGKSLQAF
jgi:hypothetical protein